MKGEGFADSFLTRHLSFSFAIGHLSFVKSFSALSAVKVFGCGYATPGYLLFARLRVLAV